MRARIKQRLEANSTCGASRRGVVTMEFILAFPIAMIGFFGLMEFGILFVVAQSVEMAAIEGAREAAMDLDDDKVRDRIDEILALANISTSSRFIRIEDPAEAAKIPPGDPDVVYDPASIPCSARGAAPVSGEVRVTICLFVSSSNLPVPDLLSSFGLSLSGKKFEVSAFAEKEEATP